MICLFLKKLEEHILINGLKLLIVWGINNERNRIIQTNDDMAKSIHER